MELPKGIQNKLDIVEQEALKQWASAGTVKKRWFAFAGGVAVGIAVAVIFSLF